jgi:hypothetical protein
MLEGFELNKNNCHYFSSMEELIQFATFQAWSCSLAAQKQMDWKKFPAELILMHRLKNILT